MAQGFLPAFPAEALGHGYIYILTYKLPDTFRLLTDQPGDFTKDITTKIYLFPSPCTPPYSIVSQSPSNNL